MQCIGFPLKVLPFNENPMQCIGFPFPLKGRTFNQNPMHCIGFSLKVLPLRMQFQFPYTKKIYNFYVLTKGIFKESLGILKDVENITNLTIFFPLFMIPARGSPVDDVLLSARKFICALSSMDAFT